MNREYALFSITILVVVSLMGATSGIGSPQTLPPIPLLNKETTINATLGLTFTLVLNSTTLHRGQTVNITAYETNVLSTPNNRTWGFDWAEEWLIGWGTIGSCNSFANVQVFQGYFTPTTIWTIKAGLTAAYPLQLAQPFYIGCPFIPGAWSTFFPFQANESRVGYYYPARGYYDGYSPNSNFTLFDPGVYTVAGGDEWGQFLILHFVVLP